MGFVALNGIRASPLMAYNGNAVCDCLMAKITKCRIAIQRVERAIAIRCHSATIGSECHLFLPTTLHLSKIISKFVVR